jgi:hypothetical protein
MLLALFACTPAGEDDAAVPFALPAADLGAPVAAETGFDPADGPGIGRALDGALPAFAEGAPLWDTPLAVWAIAMDDAVRTAGACPAEQIDGDTHTYLGDCRSSFGYAYAGEATERTWTEDGVDRERLAAELEVIGDVEGAEFDRAALSGAVERAVPEDGRVDAHYDVNLRLSLEGYWSQRGADDPREATWADWAVSGTAEVKDGLWRVDLAVDIGGAGGMRVVTDALAREASCPIEADGEATLADGVTAILAAATCDACAEVRHGGGTTQACRPE